MDLGIKESCALMMIAAFIHFIVKSVLKNKVFDQDQAPELEQSNPSTSADLLEKNSTSDSSENESTISKETSSSEIISDITTTDCLVDSAPNTGNIQEPSEPSNSSEGNMTYSEENLTSNASKTLQYNPSNAAELEDISNCIVTNENISSEIIEWEEMFDAETIVNNLLNQTHLKIGSSFSIANLTNDSSGNNPSAGGTHSSQPVTSNETISIPPIVNDILNSPESSLNLRMADDIVSLEQDQSIQIGTDSAVLIPITTDSRSSSEKDLESNVGSKSLQPLTSEEQNPIVLSVPTDNTNNGMFQLCIKIHETLVKTLQIASETLEISSSLTQSALNVNEISEYVIESPKIVIDSTVIETTKKLLNYFENVKLANKCLKFNLNILDSQYNMLDASRTTFEELKENITTALSILRLLATSIVNFDAIGTALTEVLYYINRQMIASESPLYLSSFKTHPCKIKLPNMDSTIPSASEWFSDLVQNLLENDPVAVVDNFCNYFQELQVKFRFCLGVLNMRVPRIIRRIKLTNMFLFNETLLASKEEAFKSSSQSESIPISPEMAPQINKISAVTNNKISFVYFGNENPEVILQNNKLLEDCRREFFREMPLSDFHITTRTLPTNESLVTSSDIENLIISYQYFPEIDTTVEHFKITRKVNDAFKKASENLTSRVFVSNQTPQVRISRDVANPAEFFGDALQVPATQMNSPNNLSSGVVATENSEDTIQIDAVPSETTNALQFSKTNNKAGVESFKVWISTETRQVIYQSDANSANISGDALPVPETQMNDALKSSDDSFPDLIEVENSNETFQVDATSEEIVIDAIQVTETNTNDGLNSSDNLSSGGVAAENSEETIQIDANPSEITDALHFHKTKKNADGSSKDLTSDLVATKNLKENLQVDVIPDENTEAFHVLPRKINGNALKSSEYFTTGLFTNENSKETLEIGTNPAESVNEVSEIKIDADGFISSEDLSTCVVSNENSKETLKDDSNRVDITIDVLQQFTENKMLDDQEVFSNDNLSKDELSQCSLETVPIEFIYPCLPNFTSRLD